MSQKCNLPCRKVDVLFVRWTDAVAESSRAHIDDAKRLSLVVNTNIGWILDEDEGRVVLAHGVSTSGEVDHFAIPTVNILERIYMNAPRTKRAAGREDDNGEAEERVAPASKDPGR